MGLHIGETVNVGIDDPHSVGAPGTRPDVADCVMAEAIVEYEHARTGITDVGVVAGLAERVIVSSGTFQFVIAGPTRQEFDGAIALELIVEC